MVLRAVAAAALLIATGAGPGTLSDTLRAAAASYYASAAQVAVVTGRDSAMDYYQRLLDDAGLLSAPAPSGYPAEMWRRFVLAFSQLDLSLATQILRRSYQPMTSIRGLGETLVRSSTDSTMQPVAVYVPASYTPGKPAPLVVFLHGRLQPESHLIALPFIDDLAEQTGTIIVAPYGAGYTDFRGSESAAYDALDAARRAFTIDAHKQYLAGYSMGGFAVFKVAPIHPEDWSAVMCIAGALIGSRAHAVTATMPNARFYVVTGAHDDTVPTLYTTATASFLRDSGLAVTFYSQPDGTHSLYSLRPALSRAWLDMERGVVRLSTSLWGGALPEEVP